MAILAAWSESVDSTAHDDNSTSSFEQDISVILNKLSDANIPEPLVVEFKHKYPCSVVRVMIPTLEGYLNNHIQYGGRA